MTNMINEIKNVFYFLKKLRVIYLEHNDYQWFIIYYDNFYQVLIRWVINNEAIVIRK